MCIFKEPDTNTSLTWSVLGNIHSISKHHALIHQASRLSIQITRNTRKYVTQFWTQTESYVDPWSENTRNGTPEAAPRGSRSAVRCGVRSPHGHASFSLHTQTPPFLTPWPLPYIFGQRHTLLVLPPTQKAAPSPCSPPVEVADSEWVATRAAHSPVVSRTWFQAPCRGCERTWPPSKPQQCPGASPQDGRQRWTRVCCARKCECLLNTFCAWAPFVS